MKVLGNNSLSSKVLIGLKFVIIVTVIAMIFITSILIKDVRDMALYGKIRRNNNNFRCIYSGICIYSNVNEINKIF